jgi:hypothetical protein
MLVCRFLNLDGNECSQCSEYQYLISGLRKYIRYLPTARIKYTYRRDWLLIVTGCSILAHCGLSAATLYLTPNARVLLLNIGSIVCPHL